MLSRVSSYDALGSFVAMPIGTFLYGWLATTVPVETLLLVSAGVYLAISMAALLSRSVRDMGRSSEEPVDETRREPTGPTGPTQSTGEPTAAERS